MNQTLQLIIDLVARQEVLISAHGYDELAEDGILVRDVITGVREAVVVEDYPAYHKGRVCSFYKGTATASPSMWCGVFREMRHHQRSWSQPIGRMWSSGQTIS
jgi:hypothetical protein